MKNLSFQDSALLMMRSFQTGNAHRRHAMWLWTLTLLCISVLCGASTAQACHAHGALLRNGDGKAQITAPVDECPLCAAPHAAMAAANESTVAVTPQTETLLAGAPARPFRSGWSFDLFSRPPPAVLIKQL